jgi:hypothetical protein
VGRSRPLQLNQRGGGQVLQPHIPHEFPREVQFGLIPFRSLLLRESQLVSFPPLTKMFPFRGFPLPSERCESRRIHSRKSHSGIPGSKAACAYPGLIAACHALLRRPSRAIPQTAWRVGLTRKPNTSLRQDDLYVAIIVS